MVTPGVTVWTAPGYSASRERAARAKERATWKRVEVLLPPDTHARLEALTVRPEGWARPSRQVVLRYVVDSGIERLERLNDAAAKRGAKSAGKAGAS